MSNPASDSKMTAMAISATTKIFRSLRRLRPSPPPRPPSCTTMLRFRRVAPIAGTRPKATPLRMQINNVNKRTRPSTPKVSSRGMPGGGLARKNRVQMKASKTPMPPPASQYDPLREQLLNQTLAPGANAEADGELDMRNGIGDIVSEKPITRCKRDTS
jgi:hypothetical protein